MYVFKYVDGANWNKVKKECKDLLRCTHLILVGAYYGTDCYEYDKMGNCTKKLDFSGCNCFSDCEMHKIPKGISKQRANRYIKDRLCSEWIKRVDADILGCFCEKTGKWVIRVLHKS